MKDIKYDPRFVGFFLEGLDLRVNGPEVARAFGFTRVRPKGQEGQKDQQTIVLKRSSRSKDGRCSLVSCEVWRGSVDLLVALTGDWEGDIRRFLSFLGCEGGGEGQLVEIDSFRLLTTKKSSEIRRRWEGGEQTSAHVSFGLVGRGDYCRHQYWVDACVSLDVAFVGVKRVAPPFEFERMDDVLDEIKVFLEWARAHAGPLIEKGLGMLR
jgi:hypothetical protein